MELTEEVKALLLNTAKERKAVARAACSWRARCKPYFRVGSFWPNERWGGIADPYAKECYARAARDRLHRWLLVAWP